MRRLLFIPAFFAYCVVHAQSGSCPNCWVIDGLPAGTVTFTLQTGNSSLIESVGSTTLELDTTGCQLWQIGQSDKLFFYELFQPCRGIMTDTILPYPVNANEGFTLKIQPIGINTIIGFNHRYWTDSAHDGGVVEYSKDYGMTWWNVKGACNMDGSGGGGGVVLTDRFYSVTDTLTNSEMAFSGVSPGWVNARVQFFHGIPLKPAEDPADCSVNTTDALWLRFRFVSDSTPDSLGGWLIGDIQVEYDAYGNSVASQSMAPSLPVFPNPSQTGAFNFPDVPALSTSAVVSVFDPLGRPVVLRQPYQTNLDLSAQPAGIFFYEVAAGSQTYRGTLFRQ